MRQTPILLSMGALLASLSLAASAQANLLTNPGFETGDLTGWVLTEANGGDGVSCFAGGSPFFGGVSEGTCAMSMNTGDRSPDAILEQTFATVMGSTYDLTFDIGNYSPSQTLGIASVLVEVLDGATVLAGFPLSANDPDPTGSFGTPVAPGDFVSFESSFVATGSSALLRITDQTTLGGVGADTMLDNFAVTQPVPEPCALLLAASTLAGCLLRRRMPHSPPRLRSPRWLS